MELEQREPGGGARPLSPLARNLVVGLQAVAAFLSRHWLAMINGFWGLLVVGAFLPPTLRLLGLEAPAGLFYTIYSFTCHQLPERSFFLYGPDQPLVMYELPRLVAAGADPANVLTLREFTGNAGVGYKLGFSDRMVSMYGGAFLGGVLFWLLSKGRAVKPIPVWLLLLMVLPMALDGSSHLISEISGLGFRESNGWAYALFPGQEAAFFTGTTFGSLNSNLRLLTGLFFGVGMMMFAYPLMALGFDDLADEAEAVLVRNRARIEESGR